MENFLHVASAFIIMDQNGKRLFSKYFSKKKKFETTELQKEFERKLFEKTSRVAMDREPDVLILDRQLCLFQMESDLLFYLVSSKDENELVMNEVLTTVLDSLNLIFQNQLEKRTLLENYDLVLLTMDEIFDNGVILDLDAHDIAKRVDNAEGMGITTENDTFAQVVKSAKSLGEITSTLFSF